MGNKQVRTPQLDRLASQGLVFTRGYVPTSLCRPSLASIMTGQYPYQHRIANNDPPGDARDAQNRARMVEIYKQSKTLAALLGQAGYASLQTGKWWEGSYKEGGFTEGMTHGDVGRGGRHGDAGLRIGRETMQPIFDFIDRAGSKPFFIWYAPMMPHTPHNPPERLLARYRLQGLPASLAAYYAMVEWFDVTVGQLMDYLETKGLARNTLVVYVADNGWVQLEGGRGLLESRAKMSPYDAGLRTPVMLRWPGRIKPRRDDQSLVSSVDLAPTILAACGLKPAPDMMGLNLLDQAALAKRRAVYGSTYSHTAADIERPEVNLKYRWIVSGRWKLIDPHAPNLDLPLWERETRRAWGTSPELYDILADPKETSDLAAKHPSVVKSLQQQLPPK